MQAGDFTYLDQPTPVGLAHRGGAAFGPNVGLENTLAAFRRAVDMGYRYLETDVHATRDGRVVAFHDTVLDRVSDRHGAIATLPYDAVREARIGGAEPISKDRCARVDVGVFVDAHLTRAAGLRAKM